MHVRAGRSLINLKAGRKDGNHQAEEFSSALYAPAKVIIFLSILFINNSFCEILEYLKLATSEDLASIATNQFASREEKELDSWIVICNGN